MTTDRRDKADSPFGNWIRHHDGLDSIRERIGVTDSDYWIHRYRAHTDRVGERAVDTIMCVEVKTYLKDVPFSQRDTLVLVDQLLRKATSRPGNGGRRYVTLNGLRVGEKRRTRCFGVHLLQLSGDRPDNSEKILWDRCYLTEDLLVEVLRFDRDPDHPMRMMEVRRHHRSQRAKNIDLNFSPAA